jgi:spore coat protein U-like protein
LALYRKSMRSRISFIVPAILVLLLARASGAAPTCAGIGGSIAFGLYDPFSSTPRDAIGTITYSCSADVSAVQVSLGASDSGRGSFTPRAMSGRGDRLQYNLFTSAARNSVWGDGTSGTVKLPLPDPHATQVAVYGRIFAQQAVEAASYYDTIIVTFTF